jgi:hypothetical protein
VDAELPATSVFERGQFHRFDAKLEQRVDRLRTEMEVGFARLRSELEAGWLGSMPGSSGVSQLHGERATTRSGRADLIKWTFVFWAPSLAVIGLARG